MEHLHEGGEDPNQSTPEIAKEIKKRLSCIAMDMKYTMDSFDLGDRPAPLPDDINNFLAELVALKIKWQNLLKEKKESKHVEETKSNSNFDDDLFSDAGSG